MSTHPLDSTRTRVVRRAAAVAGEAAIAPVRIFLGSRLVERVAGEVAEQRVLERAVAELMSRGAVARLVDQLIEAGFADELTDRLMAARLPQHLAARLSDSGELERLLILALASDEARLVLDHVARSPELRAALPEQGTGLAEDVASGVRARTRRADAAAEGLARSLRRRRSR